MTFYETQTKQCDIFSIFYVLCTRPFKRSINATVTKTSWLYNQNVTKQSFASVRMCDCKRLSAHNFVDFLSSDDPNQQRAWCCDVDHRHDVRRPISHARRYADDGDDAGQFVQSPFTVVEMATTTVAVESPTDLFVASH